MRWHEIATIILAISAVTVVGLISGASSSPSSSWTYGDCMANFANDSQLDSMWNSGSSLQQKCNRFSQNVYSVYLGILDVFCQSSVSIEKDCWLLRGNFSMKTCREGAQDCTFIPNDYVNKFCLLSNLVVTNQSVFCQPYLQARSSLTKISGKLCEMCSGNVTYGGSGNNSQASDSMTTWLRFGRAGSGNSAAVDMFYSNNKITGNPTRCEDVFLRGLATAVDLTSYFCPTPLTNNQPTWLNVVCAGRSFVTEWIDGFPVLFSDLHLGTCLIKSLATPLRASCSLANGIAIGSVKSAADYICKEGNNLQQVDAATSESTNAMKTDGGTTMAVATTTSSLPTTSKQLRNQQPFIPGQYCDLPVIENGYFDWVSFECDQLERKCRRNGQVQITCNVGYSVVGPTSLNCVQNNQAKIASWDTALMPKCSGCPIPSPPPHSSFGWISNGCNTSSNTCGRDWYVQYICDNGYSPIGQSRITCTGNLHLEFDAAPAQCVGCDIPSMPENTILDYLSLGCNVTEGKCGRGWELNYGCPLGSTPDGPTKITCTGINGSSLNWDNSPPTCLSCQWQAPPENGFYLGISPGCNVDEKTCARNFSIQYGCNSGYSPEGMVKSTCITQNANPLKLAWDYPPPHCIACVIPNPPDHGSYDYLSSGCSAAEKKCGLNEFVQFGCHLGYSPIGSTRLTCKSIAGASRWDSPLPLCTGCDIPSAPDHGSVALTLGCNTAERKCSRDWFVQFDCNSGYRLNGPGKLTCSGNETLKWNGSPPSCIRA